MRAALHHPSLSLSATLALVLNTFLTISAAATTQLVLSRDGDADRAAEYKGVVDVTVNPGVDDAHVSIAVDGQKLADGLRSPYKVTVDLGPTAIEHRITVTAWTKEKRRIQWHETINRGKLPLAVKLKAVDLASRTFEAAATAPTEDPIAVVQVWDAGKVIAEVKEPPYRFTIAPENFHNFVEVTARTKSGEEAADFWSASGDVHVESVDVRTVPIFVSVVDGNGVTHDDVDRSLFRILDNDSEGKIIEFGKAFDQPISIALLLDASASMTYAIDEERKAALSFVQKTLKEKDRCAVFAIRDVPKRIQEITDDRTSVRKAVESLNAGGRTALYDGISGAIRELKDEKNRRAIVVLTDGGDTSSNYDYDEIEKQAREAGIPVYFIAYDTGGDITDQDLGRMKYIAGDTGGFVATASEGTLMAKYAAIERDLRAQFAIRYQVTDYSRHNEWRRVRVVLNSPKLTARTIKGYYAP
jgi:VWFA-related protein